MKKLYQKRPVFHAHQFLGLEDIDMLKALTNRDDYTLTSDSNGDMTICIAHWHIPQGSWLLRDEHGIFRVLDDVALNKEFE